MSNLRKYTVYRIFILFDTEDARLKQLYFDKFQYREKSRNLF